MTLAGLVLLVGDDVANCEIGRCMRESIGCSVKVAEDGCTAIAITRNVSGDANRMDMQMPAPHGPDTPRVALAA